MISKELAAKLGLSAATVSLALNNRPGVSPVTRARVMEEAYRCGMIAENMLPGHPKRILFLKYRKNGQGSNRSYFAQIFSGVIEGVEQQTRNKGCELSIRTADAEDLTDVLQRMDSEEVSGLIVLATEMEEEQMLQLDRLPYPVVLLDNYCERTDLPCVMINNEQGVELAVQYLIQHGHRDIGYIHVEGDAVNFRERCIGFYRSMMLHQLPVREENVIRFSTLYGGEAVFWELRKKLENRKTMPTAFAADNDIVAVYAIKVLRELGFRIPEDVSIIGFDNIPVAEWTDPPLTSICTSRHELGGCAVNQLIDRMQNELQGIQKIALKTWLVERKSVRDIRG